MIFQIFNLDHKLPSFQYIYAGKLSKLLDHQKPTIRASQLLSITYTSKFWFNILMSQKLEDAPTDDRITLRDDIVDWNPANFNKIVTQS